jgi:hypothetical protein
MILAESRDCTVFSSSGVTGVDPHPVGSGTFWAEDPDPEPGQRRIRSLFVTKAVQFSQVYTSKRSKAYVNTLHVVDIYIRVYVRQIV